MMHILKKAAIACAVAFSCITLPAQVRDPFRHHLDDTLSTAVVTTVKEKMRNTTQTGMVRLDQSMLKRGAVSFGTPDIVRTLLTLPGVAAGNELMSGMYVHGGDGTDNLYLLDGTPLYNISHFGGIFSSFNTDVVKGLDFYKSGFPARYGTRLSSVVDVDTAPGDFERYHGNVSLGLIDGRIHVEGPVVKGKTSFNVAYRRSWMDMMIALAMKIHGDDGTKKASYFMNDLNAGITHKFSEDNVLRANFFWGADDLGMKLRQDATAMDLDVEWGNLSGNLSWNYKINKQLRLSMLGYFTRSRSDTDYGIQLSSNSLADRINSSIRDAGARCGVDWFPTDNHHVRCGVDFSYKMYRYKGQAKDPSDPSSPYPTLSRDACEPSIYIEDEFFILYNFTLNAGLRYTAYALEEKTWHSVEPRAALKWSPVHFMDVKLSYSRMSQGDHLVASSYMDLPSNTWMPSTGSVRPVLSDQVSGGLYFRPLKGMKANVEGWYKTMDHMLSYVGPNSIFPPVENWETCFAEGRGRSYGLETELSWSNEKLSATAYYTLSWSTRRFDAVHPDWYPAHSDNRHKVDLIFSWKILRSLELFASWNYHTGNRVTFPTNVTSDGSYLYGAPYNFTLPSYHRMDLGISYVHAMKHDQAIEVNASIYNVYNHKNAFFAYLKTNPDGSLEGVAYSVVPVFPTVNLSYRF